MQVDKETDQALSLTLLEPTSEMITTWSDDKKQEFCKTFEDRATVSRVVLNLIGDAIVEAAERRFFIPKGGALRSQMFESKNRVDYDRHGNKDRSWEELQKIARDRAQAIVSELPRSVDAVNIIDPETATKMRRKDKIEEQLNDLHNEYTELDDEVNLADVPQDWTVAQFRQHLDDEVKKREKLVAKISKLAKDGKDLERQISKKLYKGLPGLREAVIKVVVAHYERSTHLGTVTRRVTEQVKYGDSEAALQLLKSFENDEVTVSDDIKKEFSQAMAALKPAKKKAASKRLTKKTTVKR